VGANLGARVRARWREGGEREKMSSKNEEQGVISGLHTSGGALGSGWVGNIQINQKKVSVEKCRKICEGRRRIEKWNAKQYNGFVWTPRGACFGEMTKEKTRTNRDGFREKDHEA